MATVARLSVADDYLDLVREFPLVPVKTDAHLRAAFRVVDRLSAMDDDRLTPGQADYLSVLTDLVERYEDERFPKPVAFRSTAEVLHYLCEQAGMTASDLGRLLGNRQLGAVLLRGDREPSKAHIRRLADHFKVSADLFLRAGAD